MNCFKNSKQGLTPQILPGSDPTDSPYRFSYRPRTEYQCGNVRFSIANDSLAQYYQ